MSRPNLDIAKISVVAGVWSYSLIFFGFLWAGTCKHCITTGRALSFYRHGFVSFLQWTTFGKFVGLLSFHKVLICSDICVPAEVLDDHMSALMLSSWIWLSSRALLSEKQSRKLRRSGRAALTPKAKWNHVSGLPAVSSTWLKKSRSWDRRLRPKRNMLRRRTRPRQSQPWSRQSSRKASKRQRSLRKGKRRWRAPTPGASRATSSSNRSCRACWRWIRSLFLHARCLMGRASCAAWSALVDLAWLIFQSFQYVSIICSFFPINVLFGIWKKNKRQPETAPKRFRSASKRTWDQLLRVSPSFFGSEFPTRNRKLWDQQVKGYLDLISSQLTRSPPVRAAWSRLVTALCNMPQTPAWEMHFASAGNSA